MARGIGKVQRRVLLLLKGGLSLLFASNPRRQLRILEVIGKEWENIDRDVLYQTIRSLYRSQLVDFKDLGGGKAKMVLSKAGKNKVVEFDIDNIKPRKQGRWDGKWRMVIFDIPKDKKKEREGFRFQLKKLGFYQFQKSVFIYPFNCDDEIDFLIEFYEIRPHVRTIVAVEIDNVIHLKKIFDLV